MLHQGQAWKMAIRSRYKGIKCAACGKTIDAGQMCCYVYAGGGKDDRTMQHQACVPSDTPSSTYLRPHTKKQRGRCFTCGRVWEVGDVVITMPDQPGWGQCWAHVPADQRKLKPWREDEGGTVHLPTAADQSEVGVSSSDPVRERDLDKPRSRDVMQGRPLVD